MNRKMRNRRKLIHRGTYRYYTDFLRWDYTVIEVDRSSFVPTLYTEITHPIVNLDESFTVPTDFFKRWVRQIL